MAVINDRKNQVLELNTDYYEPTVISAQDYFPFGQEMGSYRSFSASSSYRYGFNGKEKDSDGEWGSTTHYDYGFRIYNASIGKFLSVDPLTSFYPWYTPYQFAGNKPINSIDLDGLEEFARVLYTVTTGVGVSHFKIVSEDGNYSRLYKAL